MADGVFICLTTVDDDPMGVRVNVSDISAYFERPDRQTLIYFRSDPVFDLVVAEPIGEVDMLIHNAGVKLSADAFGES